MNESSIPPVSGILETALYVADMQRATRFYQELFGFTVMVGDERFYAMNVAGRQVLLLFLQGGTREGAMLPGGWIPGHDGSGETHFAFSIAADQLQPWLDRLAAHGIEVEGQVKWHRGGVSIYFRDPDRHLVELVTPGIWDNY